MNKMHPRGGPEAASPEENMLGATGLRNREG